MSQGLAEQATLVKWAARRFGVGLDPDDALSEAWWKAYQAVESYQPGPRSMESWVVLNVKYGLSDLRKAKARRAAIAVVTTSTSVVENSASVAADPFALEALDVLQPRQRQAVELVFRQGLTLAEAGEAMGITTPSVWTLIARARRRLLEAA